MRGLAGRRALVTGGAGAGIGGATVRRLAEEGVAVVVADVDARRVGEVVDAVVAAGHRAEGLVLDVSDRAAVAALGEDPEGFDLLVCSAAVNEIGRVDRLAPDAWDRVLDVDLTAPFHLARAVLPRMRERGAGAIVNLGSAAAMSGDFAAGASAYNAAKAGLGALTRAIAAEAGPVGVRANAVAPGIVRSPFVEANAQRFADEAGRTPLRRFAEPEEVAAAIAFLLSEDASFITGETLLVTGGRLALA